MEELTKAQEFEKKFNTFFDEKVKGIIEDNRKRYRMILADKEEREKRGLSTIPSVKSTSVVDRAVEKALVEYHGEPDAIAFNTRKNINDIGEQQRARWLTEIFKHRSQNTFPFFTWHASSLTAGYVDGLEAAMVRWHKESYTEKKKTYHYINEMGVSEEISEEAYLQGVNMLPDNFYEDEVDEEVVTTDTFWIDSLRPGEELLWDFKAPLLNLNVGKMCLVKTAKTLDELQAWYDLGVIDKFNRKLAEDYLDNKHPRDEDITATGSDVRAMDGGDLNRAEVWIFFEKKGGKWLVEFSIEGEYQLTSKKKNVNDVFFAGRRVNKLPVVLGCHKIKLWENLGRGEPETIAPLEDELVQHKNNVADAAKIAIQGRYRIDRDADINLDDLLNGRAFYADEGEVEKIDTAFNTLDSLRVEDAVAQQIAELVPQGMESKNLVPRGNARTLGAIQLGLSGSNEKQGVQLLVRNETFLKPLLYLIGQLIIAHETDETILRVAADSVMQRPTDDAPASTPFQPPVVPGAGGQPTIDLKSLDIDFTVIVNAGLGTAPRQEKANNIIQLADWRVGHGVPTDMMAVAAQLNILSGFDERAFTPQQPPQPKQPEIKTNINVDIESLPPQLQQYLLQQYMSNNVSTNYSVYSSRDRNNQGERLPIGGEDELALPPGGIEQGGQGGF